MSAAGTIYIIASSAKAGQDKVNEMHDLVRAGSLRIPSDTNVVMVVKESDMRGRKVTSDDTAVICGDWSGRRAHEVQQLVEMFNTRRESSRAARLTYRAGEAPEVGFPQFEPSTETIQTLNGNSVTIGIETTSTTTSAQVAWDQVLPSYEQRVVQDAQDEAKKQRAIAADMRSQVAKVKAEIKQLREWLSGVQPVEDAEIPGIFWCAVCSKRLPDHLPDCPAG